MQPGHHIHRVFTDWNANFLDTYIRQK
jgi:hypothetical protein